MKRFACLGALAVLTLTPALVLADGLLPLPGEVSPVPVAEPGLDALAASAHDLTVATGELSHALAERGPSDPLHESARELHRAAAQFEQGLTLGQDEEIRQSFTALERSYDVMRDEIRSGEAGIDPDIHRAWSAIRNAYQSLTVAWSNRMFHIHPLPPPPEPRPPIPEPV